MFKVGLTGSEGASVALILKELVPRLEMENLRPLENPLAMEMTVTVVNSVNPERKVKKAIPVAISRLGAQFYNGSATHQQRDTIRQIMVDHA